MTPGDDATAGQPSCAQATQVVGWAMHALEPSDEQAFAEHVAHCPECASAVQEVRDLMVALAAASDQGDPPARLRASLMDAVRATPRDSRTGPLPSPTGASSTAGSRRPPSGASTRGPVGSPAAPRGSVGGVRGWRRAALAVAAVAAVVVGGGLVARQAQPPAPTGVQAEAGQLLAQVDQPGASHAILSAPDGRPLAAVMRRDDRVDVVAAPDMPANQPTTMYVLWGAAPSGPVALGSFAVGTVGRGPTPVGATSSSAYPGYAVSVEPAGPLPRTPSRVLASGAVVS